MLYFPIYNVYTGTPNAEYIERRFYFMTDNEKRAHDLAIKSMELISTNIINEANKKNLDTINMLIETYIEIYSNALSTL